MDPAERQQYHRQQSPELAINCISNFSNLRYLDLRFSGANSDEPIDLSPLGRCRLIHQLDLQGPNTNIVKDICNYLRLKCLALGGCELDDEMTEAIIKNRNIESIQFNFCSVSAEQLQSLKGMENLQSIHFFQCQPKENEDGTFDFEVKPMAGGFLAIEEGFRPLKAKAAAWLRKELPGVSISGLN